MKSLHTATAMIEAGPGLALLGFPSATAMFLIGAPPEGPAALTVARIAGAGLLALGISCWLARSDTQSRAARGLVAGMLLYNILAVAVLAYAGLGFDLHGVGLWPTVTLHVGMAFWCGACLREKC